MFARKLEIRITPEFTHGGKLFDLIFEKLILLVSKNRNVY